MALWGIHLRGQNIPVTKKFDFSSGLCRTELDSMFVLPSSIDLRYADNQLPVLPHLFEFNFQTSEIVLSDSLCNLNIILSVSYNTLDIKRKFSVFHKHFDSYHSENNDSLFVRPVSPQKQFTPYESDGLVKQGNISRSVSLGNTQGASLQSSLDIKLSGKLNNDVEILAVITDNSIPVQPEGNTQQIQEFDKVFIELRKNLTMLRVGDIDLTRPEGYFMNYTKKNQGAVLTTGFKAHNLLQNKDSIAHSMQLSGGISKGKFARNIFPGINGNQGPYKLTGAENELFIIILAGTERVFVNGEQMTRGQNYDYVIDYNTAELFFTTARLITNDSRIIIEFEYSDKNYVRSLIAGNYNYTGQRLDFRLNLYSEQDSKNQSRQQLLDDNDIFTLQLAGDDPMAAVVPGWDSVGFSGNYVLYAMVDSMGYDSVFVYSINPENAKYSVHFSFVGKNKGNYIQDKIPANGRVFKWIQPVGGIPQGEYEPYEVVIAPKKSQMASVGLDFRIAERTVAGFELAMSNNDLNTFSSIGDNNNSGTAGRFYMKHISILSRDSLSPVFTLHEEVIYEFVEARFTQIDRFRPVEFDRDWNILPEDSRSNEHIMSGVLSLYKKAKRPLMFRSDYFIKAGKFTGNRNLLHVDVQNSKINIRNKIMFMNSDLQTLKTNFFSQKGLVFVPAGPLVIGAAFDHEINNFKLGGDSLSERSYSFVEIEPYIANSSDSTNINFRLWYKTRQSKGVYMGILDDALITNESGVKFRTEISPQNSISLSGVYRVTNVKDTTRTNINDDRSILSRFEHNFRFFNGSITSFMFYEIGGGLESKKEFSYIEVAQGQGQFTWIDYNQNGIKELDEFETANYQDEASYIRILFPSGDYIRVFTLQLNETLIIEPMRAWKNDTTFLKSFLSRFSDRFQYAAGKKNNFG
jgi:hypothetical protein